MVETENTEQPQHLIHTRFLPDALSMENLVFSELTNGLAHWKPHKGPFYLLKETDTYDLDCWAFIL